MGPPPRPSASGGMGMVHYNKMKRPSDDRWGTYTRGRGGGSARTAVVDEDSSIDNGFGTPKDLPDLPNETITEPIITTGVVSWHTSFTPPHRKLSSPVVGCWLAADMVTRHTMNILPQVDSLMYDHGIQPHQYALFGGFEESLIRSGIGYLQQVHVISSMNVDAASPLLTQLGKLFSPYCAEIFTPSTRTRLPVFKADGTVWDFDEFAFATASKLIDHGSSGTAHPALLCSSAGQMQKSNSKDGKNQHQDSSNQDGKSSSKPSDETGNGKGHENDKGKGKSRDDPYSNDQKRSDEDEDMGEDNNDDDMDPGEGNPLGSDGGPHIISFEVVSELYSINSHKIFQYFKSEGYIAIQIDKAMPFKKYQLEFKKCRLVSVPAAKVAFEQYHLQVTMDSRRKNAKMDYIKPQNTLTYDRESKVVSASKVSWGAIGGLSAIFSVHPQVSLTATGSRSSEQSQSSEQKKYDSRISETDIYGAVWWGFNVDDPSERCAGIKIDEENLPSAQFMCRSDNSSDPLEVEVASYWSLIPKNPSDNVEWIARLLSRDTNSESRISYSNLAQFVVLTIPCDLQENSGYTATMKVNDGPQTLNMSDLQVREQYGSVEVASGVYGNKYGCDFHCGEGRRESMLRLPSLHNVPYNTDLALDSSSVAKVSELPV